MSDLVVLGPDYTMSPAEGMTLDAALGAIADRYEGARMAERSAAQERARHVLDILERLIDLVGYRLDPYKTMTCRLCQGSVAGVVNPRFFWVLKVPHTETCPAGRLAEFAR